MKKTLLSNKILIAYSRILFTQKFRFLPTSGHKRQASNIAIKQPFGFNDVMRGELVNGVKLAAGQLKGGPMCAITIMYMIGSRNEVDDEMGLTHILRAGSYCSGVCYTGLTKARYLQQKGAVLSCSSDRCTFSYTLLCPSVEFEDLSCFLLDTGARSCYADYELDEVRKIVREDLDRRRGEEHVIDLVQKALFGGELSNSIYCEEARINSINAYTVAGFIGTLFTADKCVIGTSGLPYAEAMRFAQLLEFADMERDPAKKYGHKRTFARYGYEVYDKGSVPFTYIAIAVPGIDVKDFYKLLRYNIIAASLGTVQIDLPQYINDRTPCYPINMMSEKVEPFTTYSAFNISYFDSGVFGILLKARSSDVRNAAFRTAEFFGNIGQLDEYQICVGKKRLKLGVMLNDDNCVRASEGLAWQCAAGINLEGPGQFCYFIERMCFQDIQEDAKELAEKLKAGQFAVAVVGDVAAVPHIGEF